ncbi:MAG: histidine kinase [Bacteroidota bacterium]
MKLPIVLRLGFIILFCPMILGAQQHLGEYFTEAEGLAGNRVYHVQRDRDDYMWFATESGVSRYDGTTFTNFTTENGLPDNDVLATHEDNEGRIWFESFSGIPSFYFEGKIHTPENTPVLRKLKFSGHIEDVFQDKSGMVWFGSWYEVIGLHLETGEMIYHPSSAAQGFWETEDEIYALEGWEYFRNLRTGECHVTNINGTAFSGGGITIQRYHDGSQILGFNTTLYRTTGKFDEFEAIPDPTGVISGLIIYLHLMEDGRLLISTRNGAVIVPPNLNLAEAQVFLPQNLVTATEDDHEGGIWFASNVGAFRIGDPALREVPGPSTNNVMCVARSGNQIAAGFANGGIHVHTLDTAGDVAHTEEFKLKLAINHLAPLEDGFVVGSDLGVFLIEDGEIRSLIDSFAVKGIAVDGNRLFCGSSRYGFIVDDFKRLRHSHARDMIWAGMATDVVPGRTYCISETEEGMFWGTKKAIFRQEKETHIRFPIPEKLLNARMTGIVKVGERMLTGTELEGLYWVDLKDSSKTKPAGILGFQNVRKIRKSPDGKVWILTQSGLLALEGIEFVPLKLGVGRRYSAKDIAFDGFGRIWLGTNSGLWYFRPEELGSVRPAPSLNLEVRNDRTGARVHDGDAFSFAENAFSFKFTGISFFGEQIRYRYRLEGADPDWNETQSNRVRYPELTPGVYTLRVQAGLEGREEFGATTSLRFEVREAFWQQTWFFVLLVLLSLGITTGIFALLNYRSRLRTRRKHQIELLIAEAEQKALRAQMNPHFIFNSLNSIQNLILNSDTTKAYKYLGKFSKLVRAILHNSRQRHIPLEEEIRFLELYLELESLRFQSQFSYEIDTSALPDRQLRIPTMIIQPFVENAILHGLLPRQEGTRRLDIRFLAEDNLLHCTVTDNGVGRDYHKTRKAHDHGSHHRKITYNDITKHITVCRTSPPSRRQ